MSNFWVVHALHDIENSSVEFLDPNICRYWVAIEMFLLSELEADIYAGVGNYPHGGHV